jgi:hypothetical protein
MDRNLQNDGGTKNSMSFPIFEGDEEEDNDKLRVFWTLSAISKTALNKI